ncbi:MAG: HIT family protein [Chlamydiota bacterium]|nr:HIT family protein [Chlamydiota bacterium]
MTTKIPPTRDDYRISNECYFCQDHGDYAEEINNRLVYEGTLARVVLDRSPSVTGHVLIIPKRHVERMETLSDEEVLEIHKLKIKLNKVFTIAYEMTDFLDMERNGAGAGQKIFHVHYHMYPANRLKSSDILNEIVIRGPKADDDELQQESKRLAKIWLDLYPER